MKFYLLGYYFRNKNSHLFYFENLVFKYAILEILFASSEPF